MIFIGSYLKLIYMNFKNLAILLIFSSFLGFCSEEASEPKNNLNDCVKNVLSPTDYDKFINNEITLEPYAELIENCMDGNLVTTTINSEEDTSLATTVDSTTTTTQTKSLSQNLKGFTEKAVNASDKWPIIYAFNQIEDTSTKHQISKTKALVEASKVEIIQIIFSNCKSNEVKFSEVTLQQSEQLEFTNENCRKGISLNSFKYLLVKNLNHEIALYGDGSYINTETEEAGCCHTLNLLDLVREHTKNINTFFSTTTTTTTTTTTIPYPPSIVFDSCPSEAKPGDTITYNYRVSGPSSRITTINFKLSLNEVIEVEDLIENNPNLALPGKSEEIAYSYEYVVPDIQNPTNINFSVYAVNERGNPKEQICSTSLVLPERTVPDLKKLEVYAGEGYEYDIGDYAPYQSTGYISGRTFRVKTNLLLEDTLDTVTFTLTPHEAIGTVFLVCERVFDKTTIYPAGYEIDCTVDYPPGRVNRFVPYNKRDREWQGWYRLDVYMIDGAGNTNTIQYCKALRIVGGWQSSYSDNTTYEYSGYYWQYWNEVYRNRGQC